MIVFKNRHDRFLNFSLARTFHWVNGDLVLNLPGTETYRVEISQEDFQRHIDGRFPAYLEIDAHWYKTN